MTNLERLEEVQRKTDYLVVNNKKRSEEELKIKQLLEEGGWIEGEHYIYTGKWTTERTTITSGNYYDDNSREHTVKLRLYKGGCVPIEIVKDDNNQPVTSTRYGSFTLNSKPRGYSTRKFNPTLTSYNITSNRRRYSAKKLLEELIWRNERKTRLINEENETKDLYEVVFNHYVGKYTNETVEKTSIYGRYTSYKGIKVTFENGNYVELRLGSALGNETVHKTFDAKLDSLESTEEVLNYFK